MKHDFVNQHLTLAKKIAAEFINIPGLPLEEIEMRAQEALFQAAHHFQQNSGNFVSFASVVIRNALRDLYERQVRHHQHHVYDLNVPCSSTSSKEEKIAQIADFHEVNVPDGVAMRESDKRILQAMETLSPRMRLVARGIGAGKTYSEIGAELGVSKQAAHKLAAAVIATLREKLENMGFSGVDTIGLLKSCSSPSTPRRMVDVFPPQP